MLPSRVKVAPSARVVLEPPLTLGGRFSTVTASVADVVGPAELSRSIVTVYSPSSA